MDSLDLTGISVATYKKIYFTMSVKQHNCHANKDGSIDGTNTQHGEAPDGCAWYEIWFGGASQRSEVELFTAASWSQAVEYFLEVAKSLEGRAFHKGTGSVGDSITGTMPLDKFIDYWQDFVVAA